MSDHVVDGDAVSNLSRLALTCRISARAAFPTLLFEDIRMIGEGLVYLFLILCCDVL